MKKLAAICIGFALAAAAVLPVYAGSWRQDSTGWWYQNDDGSYPANTWQWIDSNGDGTAECYYFYPDGYMAYNNDIDGYHLNSSGQWELGGKIQQKTVSARQYKSPVGTFYINGQYVLTMPETYKDSYYHCINIGEQEGGGYWFVHVTGRHPGTAVVKSIQPNVPTRYAHEYKGWTEETGEFIYDGRDTITLKADGTNETLTFIRGKSLFDN